MEERAIATSRVSDHVFRLMPFFGYRFAQRRRDLKDLRLHLLSGMTIDRLLARLAGFDVEHAARH